MLNVLYLATFACKIYRDLVCIPVLPPVEKITKSLNIVLNNNIS